MTQAPPWVERLLIPFAARNTARALRKQYPGLGADEIVRKLQAGGTPGRPVDERFIEEVRAHLRYTEPVADPAVSALTETPTIRAGIGTIWRSPSALLLVAANLVPLYGVVALDWPVFPIVLLFWLENVVIGLLNVLRMLSVAPRDTGSWLAKLFAVPFFCFHYGMFATAHGAFMFRFFGGREFSFSPIQVLETARQEVASFDLTLPLAVLVGSHVYSFLWNYLWKGEFRTASLPQLMARPYRRVVVLHLVIMIGAAILMAVGSPAPALVVLVGLKIAIDLKAHLDEHSYLPETSTGAGSLGLNQR